MSRIKLYLNKLVTVILSCGSCIKPKPKPKSTATKPTPKQPATTQLSHCSYYESPNNMKSPASVGGKFGRMGGDGLAVEKDSDDPYLDFRQSMLQMIVENEIYSKDDLIQLLNCFLQLNSPYHQGIIFRAFTDICNGVVFSVRPTAASTGSKRTVKRKSRHTAAKVRQARRTDRYVG